MKISIQSAILLVCTVSATAAAKEQEHHSLRKQQRHRQLQVGQDNDQGDLDNLLGDLQNGFAESMIDLSVLQTMDPLVLLEAQSFQLEDTWNITNCTDSGPINVTLTPITLTGLSTLSVERFVLVRDTTTSAVEEDESTTTNNDNWFWEGITSLWSGTFDMLVTAESMVLEGTVTLQTQDGSDSITCYAGAEGSEYVLDADNGGSSWSFQVNLINPVLDMKLDIGGSTNSGSWFGLGASESEADSVSTDEVSFTYDSWTIAFVDPESSNSQPTILNVSEVLDDWGSFFSDALNTTNWDDANVNVTALEDGFNIDAFIQDQVNSIMKGSSFSF